MEFYVKISEYDIKKILADYISERVGYQVDDKDIKIEVKSKQNFKSEWELAHFRAEYIGVG